MNELHALVENSLLSLTHSTHDICNCCTSVTSVPCNKTYASTSTCLRKNLWNAAFASTLNNRWPCWCAYVRECSFAPARYNNCSKCMMQYQEDSKSSTSTQSSILEHSCIKQTHLTRRCAQTIRIILQTTSFERSSSRWESWISFNINVFNCCDNNN